MMPVSVNAPTMLSQTSSLSTVINLNRDAFRTGFLMTREQKLNVLDYPRVCKKQ
jgi:hypothetical protein